MRSAPDWQTVRRLFHEAIQRPVAERAVYLDQHCGDDVELRQELQSLLAANESAEGFLDGGGMTLPESWRDHRLRPGERFGAFEIVDVLGVGGMGEVYRARDMRLGREVAVKLLPVNLAGDADRRARFERESRLLATLNHPHIAALHSVEDIDGQLALVLELVEGPTLAERIASAPLPLIDALQIARDLASALEAAHNKDVVHRDLKPANVKFTPDGIVKLLDFGLAKAIQRRISDGATDAASAGLDARTHDGMLLGTGPYMSPEQARGQHVDKRTDIWAFGCVLFEMITRQRAFSADTIPDTLAAILDREPDWGTLPAAVPPEVQRLLRRCLQKDPRHRTHDIADVRLAIEDALETGVGPQVTRREVSRTPRLAIVGVVAVVVTGVVLSVAAWTVTRPASPAVTASAPTYLTLPLPEGISLQSAPAVSHDGASIAFVGSGREGARLYLRRLSSPDFHVLPGTGGARQPFWSPDGQWLAFFAGNRLKKVAIDGGAPLDICNVTDPSGGSWGPSGLIVFTPHLIDSPVYRVSADGGSPEPVTILDESHGENSHRWPVFLPDGIHFLYFVRSSDDGRRGIYLGRVDGPAQLPGVRLVESESDAAYVTLQPQSSGAVMTADHEGVRIQRFDATTRRLLGAPRLLNVRAGASTAHERAMFGASATTLATVDQPLSRSSRLASAARDGSVVHVWPEREVYNWPRLSPDGMRLVFQRVDQLRGSPDLWVRDLIRGTETRVTAAPAHGLLPVWSPDGNRLAFLWGRISTATPAIGPADGTKTITRRDCPARRCEPSDWSPDGRTLIVTAYTPKGADVWALPVDPTTSATARPLFAESFNERDARISPDGEWIAYVSDESGRNEISVRRMSGRDRTVISKDGGHQPVWRRDGSELFYVDPDGALRAVAINRRADGVLVPRLPVLVNVPPIGAGHWGTQYDVSPDGSRVYYVDRDPPPPSRRIEVILNWSVIID